MSLLGVARRRARRRARRPRRGGEDGSGLVEVLVVLVISGIVGTIVLSSIISTTKVTREGEARAIGLADLSVAVERVSRELRVADPLLLDATGAYGSSVGARTLRAGVISDYRFRMVTLPSGVTELVYDQIVYAANGSVVSSVTGHYIERLANGTEPLFRYFDRNGHQITHNPATEIATAASVRDRYMTAARIEITILKAVDNGTPLRGATAVQVRNTRYGG